jgi:hypothetical protein
MSQVCKIDTIRTLAFGSISGSYTAVGGTTTNATRLFCITNNTDGDMFFSDDGINNKLFLPASSFKLFDICSNRDDVNGVYLLPSSMQWYVKQSTSPTKGAVYIELLYGMQ